MKYLKINIVALDDFQGLLIHGLLGNHHTIIKTGN